MKLLEKIIKQTENLHDNSILCLKSIWERINQKEGRNFLRPYFYRGVIEIRNILDEKCFQGREYLNLQLCHLISSLEGLKSLNRDHSTLSHIEYELMTYERLNHIPELFEYLQRNATKNEITSIGSKILLLSPTSQRLITSLFFSSVESIDYFVDLLLVREQFNLQLEINVPLFSHVWSEINQLAKLEDASDPVSQLALVNRVLKALWSPTVVGISIYFILLNI